MTRFHLLLIMSITLTSSALLAQSTVKGTLVDSLNQDKLFYVSVGIVTTDSTMQEMGVAYTEADGSFSISGVPSGSYLLRASYLGYETLDILITVPAGRATVDLGTIRMKNTSTTLEGISVTATKPVYMVDGEKTLYNVSEDPSVQTGTASDALQNAPGVEVDVEGNITLRGVSSVEIWINDKPSHLNEEGLKTFIQQLPANSLERIEVITNPSARYSAKGTGGIINIVTSSKIKKNSFVSFGISGSSQPDVRPWVSYVWSNNKLSLNFYINAYYSFQKTSTQSRALRFNEQMDTSSATWGTSLQRRHSVSSGFYFNGDYEFDTLNSISFWAGGYPSWGKSSTSTQTLRSEYLYNPDVYSYESAEGSQYGGGGGYGGIYYEHKFKKEGHKISADLSGNTYYYNAKRYFIREYDKQTYLNRNKKSGATSSMYNVYASIDYTYPYHKNGELSVGVDGYYNFASEVIRQDTLLAGTLQDYQIDSLRLQDSEERNYSFTAYATLQHKFGNFTLKGGLRSEYEHFDYRILNSPTDNVKKAYCSLYPSLHLSYRTESMHNFKLSYTRRVQNPYAEQLTTFISYDEESYSIGNPGLKQTF
ncbi:MAG: outer membrane beta-barrel protein, partial [Bacteroidales bacterium]|nr:outer membrane beta-barrel protein [Bacteroidales bacterium]